MVLNENMKKRKFFILLIAVILSLFILFIISKAKASYIKIGGNKINVEIVDTDKTRYRGLSGRKYLCDDCGMLFVFDNSGKRDFAMRNMNFPLDIIWIKENKIVKIDKNLLPEGNNPTNIYSSVEPVDTVLEVNALFCDEKGIKEGEEVKILKN